MEMRQRALNSVEIKGAAQPQTQLLQHHRRLRRAPAAASFLSSLCCFDVHSAKSVIISRELTVNSEQPFSANDAMLTTAEDPPGSITCTVPCNLPGVVLLLWAELSLNCQMTPGSAYVSI